MSTNKASIATKADQDFKSRPTSAVFAAQEALKPQPPIPWVVDQLFTEGSLSIVFGEAGTYKTYSLLDCGVCIALGEPWVGFETTQNSVLFIDLDSTRKCNRLIKEYLKR